jgi:hypothetical protein
MLIRPSRLVPLALAAAIAGAAPLAVVASPAAAVLRR